MGEQRNLFSQGLYRTEFLLYVFAFVTEGDCKVKILKKIFIGIFGFLVLSVGLALVCYPFISNYLMSQNHDSEIAAQADAVNRTDDDILDEMLAQAEIYNKNLMGNVVLTDPFDPGFQQEDNAEYESLLNINNDSIMASVEIPRINVKLPIYHGTAQDTLLNGVGHLQKTSLPIGGKGTHAVITGHSGLSSARFFTDLDKLETGDVFYIYVLNKALAYQVDQIKVVAPTDTSDLKIDSAEDYVTLVTCTPYGVNSHRLLVRGTRIPYEEAKMLSENSTISESTWMLEYRKALVVGAGAFVAVIIVFVIIKLLLSKRKKNKSKSA